RPQRGNFWLMLIRSLGCFNYGTHGWLWL
ncbi:unnamed protein product, partial [Rotaria magnacalcarata]